jgi:uncharacterized protein YihD (DUF1040 family)
MALYPAAKARLLSEERVPRRPLKIHNRINLHVTAGKGSPFTTFDKPGAASSHFFVYKDGEVEQFVDTKWQAEADLDGNDATVSIETEGGYPNNIANKEEWTDEQIASLVKLIVWLHNEHGFELKLASSSKTDDTSKGISWHRLGIDGNFPDLPSMLAGRKQRGGGMHYSNATGKACPGDAKIKQIPAIVQLAVSAANSDRPEPKPEPKPEKPSGGGGSSKPGPAPEPKPEKPEPPKLKDIKEDGFWGEGTTTRAQIVYGTTVDGFVSSQYYKMENANPGLTTGWEWLRAVRGSELIKAIQSEFGAEPDGVLGPKTIKKMQKHYGVERDGFFSGPSLTIKKFQAALNDGKKK